MDLMKDVLGSSEPKVEPKPAPKVETKTAPKVETKTAPKVETKTASKVETKTASKAQPVDNEKLRRLEHELDQAEHDYTDSIWPLMRAKQQYTLLSNGYELDPESSSKEAVLEASATLADCQSRQDAIDRRRKSLKKQIAELKGGANSQ